MVFCGRSLVAAAAGAAALVAPAAAQLQLADTDSAVTMHEINAVDCGGHYAENCDVCPAGNSELWCNGECVWVNGSCKDSTFWNHLVHFTHWTFWVWWHTLPISFLIALSMTAYACVYKKKIVDDIPQEAISANTDPDFDKWSEREVGLFDVFKQPPQCMWAFFCTPVVSAKNFATGAVLPFWPGCVLVFTGIFCCFWPVYLVMACVRTKYSSDLQKNLGFKPNFLMNFLLTLFCLPCEVGRESIEVNQALGVELTCPFEVEKTLRARFEMMEEAAERTCHRVCS